jgi:hypothetical protein
LRPARAAAREQHAFFFGNKKDKKNLQTLNKYHSDTRAFCRSWSGRERATRFKEKSKKNLLKS